MPDLNIGGQAVIEGVMMRSSDRLATAVRIPSGEILVKTEDFLPIVKRYKFLDVPIVRGAISFVEMMVVGIKTLNFSADIAVREAEKEEAAKKGEEYNSEPKKLNSLYLTMTVVIALGMGIGLFFFLPLWIASLLGIEKDAVVFNLMAGGIRLSIFLAYVYLISLFSEFNRIFQYHGAEHKSIYAYEMGDELTPESAAKHTRFHPRCGTSFILIVALFAMFCYSISDSIFTIVMGYAPELLTRFALHFSLLPFVAGGSYELLKISGKTRDNALTKILIKPGLWLQKITTKEPSADQLEVALAALEASLGVVDSKLTSVRTPVS